MSGSGLNSHYPEDRELQVSQVWILRPSLWNKYLGVYKMRREDADNRVTGDRIVNEERL